MQQNKAFSFWYHLLKKHWNNKNRGKCPWKNICIISITLKPLWGKLLLNKLNSKFQTNFLKNEFLCSFSLKYENVRFVLSISLEDTKDLVA